MTTTVALIGANGHGRWHRRRLAEVEAAGRARLVAVADVRPLDPDPPVGPGGPVSPDPRGRPAEPAPEVVVICPPPHPPLQIALDAIAAGCALTRENPPVASLAAHHTLTASLNAAG